MAFKTILFVCGFSIQNAYSQVSGLGYNGLGYSNGLSFTNAFAPYDAISLSDVGVAAVDVSSIDGKSIGLSGSYGGLGIAGASGLGAANIGVGAAGLGVAGVSNLGLGLAGVNNAGLGVTGISNAAPVVTRLSNAGLGIAGVSNAGLGGLTLSTAPVTADNLGALSSGGLLPISSQGAVIPAGLTVVSDNIIEGTVKLNGQMPFLTAVAFEGALPSGGSGLAQCGCGTAGNIGIISDSVGPVINASNLGGLALSNLGGVNLGNYAGRLL